jgi:hypothetical protein
MNTFENAFKIALFHLETEEDFHFPKLTLSQMKLTQNLDPNKDYNICFSYGAYDPELDEYYKVKKTIKYDKEEEYDLIDKQYEMIAERRTLIITLNILKDIHFGWENMKRRKKIYQNIKAILIKRNNFNKLIAKRNKNLKPPKHLLK